MKKQGASKWCLVRASVAALIFIGGMRDRAVGANSSLMDGSLNIVQLMERLKTEAIPQWQEMASKLNGVNFTYTLSETSHARGATRSGTKHVAGHVSGDCFLLKEASENPSHTSVYGRNGRYEFSIDRTGTAPWVISWQGRRRDSETPVGTAFEYLVGMLELPWSISATPLEKLVSDARFKITRATSKKGVVEFDFEVAPAIVRPDPLQNLVGGRVVLDSLHHWAIRHYDATYLSKMTSTLQLAYGPAGPPELQQVEFEIDSPPNSSNKFSLGEIHYDTNAMDTARFSLPAYGLPEYREPFGPRRWLVLVNIGIICVVLGMILLRGKLVFRGRTVRDARAGTVSV